MAKEGNEDEGKETEGEAPKAKGKRGLIKWGIIGVIVVVVAGGGLFGWKIMSKKGGEESGHATAPAAEKEEAHSETAGQMIPLESFIVNLADSAEIKYLKVTVNLEVAAEGVSEEVQSRMPQIRDGLLMLLTSKTSNDVKEIGGKLKLQDEMVARVNNYLKEGKIKAVYFTEFVMQ